MSILDLRTAWLRAVCALVLCGSCTVGWAGFTQLDGNAVHAMTTEQRIAYMADAYVAASKIPGPRVQGNSVFKEVIRPLYGVIARTDGVAMAAQLYGMTFGDQVRQPGTDWYGKAKASGMSDAGFMKLFSAHRFPALQLSGIELASLENDVTQELVRAAEKGDTRACAWMATSRNRAGWTSEATSACVSVASAYGTPISAADAEVQYQQEAARRAQAGKAQDVQRAQEVTRYCASVGVTNPVIDPTKVQTLVRRWDKDYVVALPQTTVQQTIDNHINSLADLYSRRTEVDSIMKGVAVTPFLTPLTYMALVKPQCGM